MTNRNKLNKFSYQLLIDYLIDQMPNINSEDLRLLIWHAEQVLDERRGLIDG